MSLLFAKSIKSNLSAVFGSIVHSISFGELEIIEEGAVIFNQSTGIIYKLFQGSLADLKNAGILLEDHILDYSGKLIIPGFIDAHCHAPQYVFSGTGMDLPLLQWLEKYTFPCESKFADDDFARNGFEKSIKRHLKCGTTFCSYFGTLHNSACEILVDVIKEVGQRAFVGKVSMDRNSPDFYIESTEMGCKDAERFVRYVLSLTTVGMSFLDSIDNRETECSKSQVAYSPMTIVSSFSSYMLSEMGQDLNSRPPSPPNELLSLLDKPDTPLVLPVITPRFVPTCTAEIMQFLGNLSVKYGLPVQSHMSESINEIAWVKELHPDQNTYAEVYESCNLLHHRAYMAHCCHSSEEELEVLKRSKAGVVHCASSNFSLVSGIMDVKKFLSEGIPVALGTDVAGGYSPSMLDAIRQTLTASVCKNFERRYIQQFDASNSEKGEPYVNLNFREVFHLATVGGAEVLGMGNVLGNFVPGKKFDALIVDPEVNGGPFDLFGSESTSEIFEKFIFLGDDRNIDTVFVDGKKVLANVVLK